MMLHTPRRTSCLAMALASVFQLSAAQTHGASPVVPSMQSQIGGASQARPAGLLSNAESVAITRNNQAAAALKLLPQAEFVIADGRSQVVVDIQVLDAAGQTLNQAVMLTLEAVNGLIQLTPGVPLALVEQPNGQWLSASEAADLDPLTPGIQIAVTGNTRIALIAPYELQDIALRVTVGSASQTVTIKALPELRDRIMVGVIEGQARFNKLAKNLVPANEGDLFERELKRYATEFDDGRGNAGVRAAFFVKGKIKGDYLLTMAADSELSARNPLFKDIDPNAFYPVYGDESVKDHDAQSTGRFYVRLDKNRSFVVYGDFNTAANLPMIQLGNTSRAMTGVKWHLEGTESNASSKEVSQLTVYASHDNLKQVVNEIPGRGISGPYSVSNSNGIAGTERVEIIVRDRFSPNNVLKTTALVRGGDYEFEPFSGKILFKAAVPSVDDAFNPVSIRIVYEVEQGGPRYWVGGAVAEHVLSNHFKVAASVHHDANPSDKTTLASVAAKLTLNERSNAVIEWAQSQHSLMGIDKKGQALRGELLWQEGGHMLSVKGTKTSNGFDNPSSGAGASAAGGSTDLAINGQLRVNEKLRVKAQALWSEDAANTAQRRSSSVAAEYAVTPTLMLGAGLRHAHDKLSAIGAGQQTSTSGICDNYGGYNGGFGIASASNSTVDSLCQNGSRFPVSTASLAAANPNTVSDSLFIQATYSLPVPTPVTPVGDESTKPASSKPSRYSFSALAEVDIHDSQKRRYELGAQYQLTERSKLFAKLENTTSATDLSNANGSRSTGLVFGASTSYAENGQLYNEYRLNDVASGKHVENAIGLRNTFGIAQGLKLSTNAEWIKVLAGNASSAKAAGVGLDYTGSAQWKSSGRIEWRQDNSAQNWLSTISLARRLDERWSLLAKNHYSLTQNRSGLGRKLEDRFLIGAAYRPVNTNWLNTLTRYEHRSERDSLAGSAQPRRTVDIVSWHGDWHPSRAWHNNMRIAAKRVNEQFANSAGAISTAPTDSQFAAWLIGARLMYDWTPRWTTGVFGAALSQTQPGKARQFGYGVEAGYAVRENVWLNLGYTVRGLNDKDLLDNNYRNRGWFVGLRYKFDEKSFGGWIE